MKFKFDITQPIYIMMKKNIIKEEISHNKKHPLSIDEFLSELAYYRESRWIFRGENNNTYLLQPSAFRGDVISVRKQIFQYNKILGYKESDESKNCVKGHLLSYNSNKSEIERIFELTAYTMMYNYFLADHVNKYPDKFDPHSRFVRSLRNSDDWQAKDSFTRLLDNNLRSSVTQFSFDGKIIKYGNIDEDIAGYEESLPQHFETQTTLLDWSYDPYVALFFALRNLGQEYFSIYLYKELQSSNNNPIKLVYGNCDCKNLRIHPQKGLFMKFCFPCTFYFENGKWPVIDNNLIRENVTNFEIIKYHIPNDETYITILQNELSENDYTEEHLLPKE